MVNSITSPVKCYGHDGLILRLNLCFSYFAHNSTKIHFWGKFAIFKHVFVAMSVAHPNERCLATAGK